MEHTRFEENINKEPLFSQLDVPESAQKLVAEGIDRSHAAIDHVSETAKNVTSDYQESLELALKHASRWNRALIEIAENNMKATLNLASNVTSAKTPKDAMASHYRFWKNQSEDFARHSQQLGELAKASTKSFTDTLNSFSEIAQKATDRKKG